MKSKVSEMSKTAKRFPLPVDGHLVTLNGDDVLLLHKVLQSVSLHIATTVEQTTVNAHPEIALRATH